jgi:dTDP-4-dehydrorhamnose reductase
MKILVTGASGMLGSSLVPLLVQGDNTVLATDIRLLDGRTQQLDVRELQPMIELSSEFRPDLLIHLAAETDLETCERDPDYAFKENYVGTQNACQVCNSLDIPIVYISTAGVFDGKKKEPYTEFDNPNPINVYGASKYEGENIVRQTVNHHFIVRAGWMIGGGERDKKFVHKIISQLREGATEVHAVCDKRGSPTYAVSFSKMLLRMIAKSCYGTYHLTCTGTATRYDVASHILRTLGREDVELHSVTSDHFSNEYFAPRPESEEMRNYLLDLTSMNEMPHWTDALDQYLEANFGADYR